MLRNDGFEYRPLAKHEQAAAISQREGELRLGQVVHFREHGSDDWKAKQFHVLGIREDVGPRANGGFGGADKAFDAFLKRFLAVQSNRFLSGDSIAVHGTVDPTISDAEASLIEQVEQLDEMITLWTSEVVQAGGIPIVIGGGHNNAYGLIRGCSKVLEVAVGVINLDPHADTRALEGRHSGNPFSYAWEEKWMDRYTVLGLHQNYNNQHILEKLNAMNSMTAFYEDWLDVPLRFETDIKAAVQLHEDKPTGIELDMDAVAGMPTSACTPSGVSMEQARIYVRRLAMGLKDPLYLHLPEAAPKNEMEVIHVGKSLAYLVTDFIKCVETVKKKC